MVPTLVDQEALPRAMAINASVMQGSIIIGPMLGGFLYVAGPAADGIILGSPTYFADITSELKALIDRSGRVGRANGGLYRRKVGSGVIAMRRGGAIHALDTINHFLHIAQMIVPGASYWNVGIGREIGDVEADEEGIRNMQVLGENMAWLLKKIHEERNPIQINPSKGMQHD